MAKVDFNIDQVRKFMNRHDCHPCDRGEAGFQLARLVDKKSAIETSLKILENVCKH